VFLVGVEEDEFFVEFKIVDGNSGNIGVEVIN
jgi:hypothetical protein